LRARAEQQDGRQNSEWLFTLPAFYAEFAPLPQHGSVADHLYVLKDTGMLTANCRVFASPFRDFAFIFRTAARMCEPKVMVVQPSFGHRKRKRPFQGWVFGVRSKLSSRWSSETETPPFFDCQTRLAQSIHSVPSSADILDILDQFVTDLTKQSTDHGGGGYNSVDVPQPQVASLATILGQSPRTLHRRMKTSTGLPPKRFMGVERFRRAVHDISMRNAKLSVVAGDLGFADQAHLTREFQRHAGLPPGAFQRAYRGIAGQVVRFVQDSDSPTRLRVAVWSSDDHG
jgi:AraC-like DNA-binding protein